jgi:hypothetical protein
MKKKKTSVAIDEKLLEEFAKTDLKLTKFIHDQIAQAVKTCPTCGAKRKGK